MFDMDHVFRDVCYIFPTQGMSLFSCLQGKKNKKEERDCERNQTWYELTALAEPAIHCLDSALLPFAVWAHSKYEAMAAERASQEMWRL